MRTQGQAPGREQVRRILGVGSCHFQECPIRVSLAEGCWGLRHRCLLPRMAGPRVEQALTPTLPALPLERGLPVTRSQSVCLSWASPPSLRRGAHEPNTSQRDSLEVVQLVQLRNEPGSPRPEPGLPPAGGRARLLLVSPGLSVEPGTSEGDQYVFAE